MATPIHIETDRLSIVPFANGHLSDDYVSWLNDPEVVRYSEQRHRTHTRESCRAYADGFVESDDSFCAIEARDLGHIGNLVVTRDTPNRTADMSIMIGATAARGQGFGAEAWGAVLAHLLTVEKLRKVTAGTMAANTAMVGVMRKTGMTIEGTRPRQFLLDSEEIDLVLAGALANEWTDPSA